VQHVQRIAERIGELATDTAPSEFDKYFFSPTQQGAVNTKGPQLIGDHSQACATALGIFQEMAHQRGFASTQEPGND
jgi:hypothetical protein